MTRGSLLEMNVDNDQVQKGQHDGDKAFAAVEPTRMIGANRKTLAGYVAATAETSAADRRVFYEDLKEDVENLA